MVTANMAGGNLQSAICLIVNPVAGKGRGLKVYARLKPFLAQLPVSFEVHFTSQPNQATELARNAAQSGKFGTVVALGGDGTVNEVLNGLMRVNSEQRPAFGIIPAGRGRDFCKADAVRLPADPLEAARTVIGNRTLKLDVGKATCPANPPANFAAPLTVADLQAASELQTRYFLNVASTGFDAAVTNNANLLPTTNFAQKAAPYYAAIYRTLSEYKNPHFRYWLDGAERSGVLNSLVIANGNYYGNGMRIAPHANPTDGQLAVVSLGNFSPGEIIALAPLLYTGAHRYYPRCYLAQGKVLQVEVTNPEHPAPIQLDGEVIGYAPAIFEIIPAAIDLKVP